MKLKVHDAEALAREERAWVCASCEVMIEEGRLDALCRTCEQYYKDIDAGVFEDDY